MPAVILNAEYLQWTLALAAGGAAVLFWRWRRGMAERRMAKGLRTYANAAQVLS
jgi:hypothetical protein